jgi:hypothetical protein
MVFVAKKGAKGEGNEPGSDAPSAYMNISTSVIMMNATS